MELRQLRGFAAVVEYGTVSAAAAALHISQPPLTTQIHLLERELKTPLFDRSTRRMQLTEAGRLLYGRARAVLDLCEDMQDELSEFLTGGTGTLRIGAVSSVIDTLVLPWITIFHQEYPGIRFDLCEGNTFELLDAMRFQKVELAFVRRPFSAQELDCIPILQDQLCAAGLPVMLSKIPEADLAGLSSVPLLAYHRWESIIRSAFSEQGLHPQFFCVADDARTIISLAKKGVGIGIMPVSALRCETTLSTMMLENPAFVSELCAVTRRGGYLTAAARQFLELVCTKVLDT